ncbi:hypothetical protein ACFFRR_002994 [Megaselia abdita]
MFLPRFLFALLVLAQVNCLSYTVTSRIYMDIKHKKENIGRIVIALFGEDAPNTVRNFRHLCLKGIKGQSYVGSTFHRVVPRFMVQGGDVVSKDGMGSISLYGKYFDDEGFSVEHNRPGYVGMANRGPNTNGCQFYITTVTASWLNGKHTVFGKVIEGLDVVHKIEAVKTDSEDYPVDKVVISNCGEIPTEPYTFYPDDFKYVASKTANQLYFNYFCFDTSTNFSF